MSYSESRWRVGLAEVLLGTILAFLASFIAASVPWAMKVDTQITTLVIQMDSYRDLKDDISAIRMEVAANKLELATRSAWENRLGVIENRLETTNRNK